MKNIRKICKYSHSASPGRQSSAARQPHRREERRHILLLRPSLNMSTLIRLFIPRVGSMNVSKENFPWHDRCQPRIIDGSMIRPSSEDTAVSASSWPGWPAHPSRLHTQPNVFLRVWSFSNVSNFVCWPNSQKSEAIARYDNTSTLLSR